MTISNMAFTPVVGLNDTVAFPTDPVNEAAARKQVQDVFDQLRDYLNNTVITKLNSTTLNDSGADNISAKEISGLVVNLTGTVSKTGGNATLTGTGTLFTTELVVGNLVTVPGTSNELKKVTAIASNTSLTVDSNFTNTASVQTAYKANDVWSLLKALKALVDSQLPTPDGSITDAKLSSSSADIKQRFSAHLAETTKHLTIDKLRTSLLYNQAIENIAADIPLVSLTQAHKAINTGTIKVAFWGDSITEGIDQVDLNEIYANRFIAELKKVIPGVTITSQNFGLASRGIAQAVSSTYAAVNPEPSDTSLGFWRSWSTAGKTWRDHVKDFAPDLLIVAFGMNDSGTIGGGADYNEYSNLVTLINYASGWTKVPSIVLIPTFLPTTDTSRYSQRQDITNSVARATREYGRNTGYPVADANRLYQILRSANDQVLRAADLVYSPLTGWGGDTPDYTFESGRISQNNTSANKIISQSRIFYNGVIEADVIPITDGLASGQIQYRYSSDLGYMAVQWKAGVGTGQIELYTSDDLVTPIAYVANLAIPAGSQTHIKIVTDGANHKIYVGNVATPTIDWTVYKKLHDGNVKIGNPGSKMSTMDNLKLIYADPLDGGVALYTEDDILGPYNDAYSSGNGINHPSGLGYALFYLPAFYGILQKLAKPEGMTTGRILASGDWLAPGGDWATTTSAGEKIWYQAFYYNYNKKLGLSLKRLDTPAYYSLSTAAITKATLASLEPGKFAYFPSPDAGNTDLIFVSVPAAGSVTWNCEMFKLE